MNRTEDPNNPQADLPDLDLPSEELTTPTTGARANLQTRIQAHLPKILVALGILAVLFIVIWYFLSGDETTEKPTPQIQFTPPAITPTNGKPFKTIQPIEAPSPTPTTNAEDLNSKDRFIVLEKKLEQLTQDTTIKLESLTQEQKKNETMIREAEDSAALKQLASDMNALKQSFEQKEAELREKMDKLSEQALIIRPLGERVAALETKLGELKKLQEKAEGTRLSLAFNVLSVDLWNGKPYVAVSMAEKVSLVTVGDVVMGWKVQSVDFDSGKAVFIKNGKRVEYLIER